MAFSKLQSGSVRIPAHWQPPRFTFNERVRVLVCGSRATTGIVKGMEYIESPDQYGQKDALEIGWTFYVLVNENDPYVQSSPVVIEPQSNLYKLSPDW
jgi:hypothetical protein